MDTGGTQGNATQPDREREKTKKEKKKPLPDRKGYEPEKKRAEKVQNGPRPC